MSERKVAFPRRVARIGRGCALELARPTGADGAHRHRRGRCGHCRLKRSSTGPPVFLARTAAECRALGAARNREKPSGRRADWAPRSTGDATFGRLDVLGTTAATLALATWTRLERRRSSSSADAFGVCTPLALIKHCLPISAPGRGIVIGVASSALAGRTPQPIGKGGWGPASSTRRRSAAGAGLAKAPAVQRRRIGSCRASSEPSGWRSSSASSADASKALPVENPGARAPRPHDEPSHFSIRSPRRSSTSTLAAPTTGRSATSGDGAVGRATSSQSTCSSTSRRSLAPPNPPTRGASRRRWFAPTRRRRRSNSRRRRANWSSGHDERGPRVRSQRALTKSSAARPRPMCSVM
jgi:hypothetical protein